MASKKNKIVGLPKEKTEWPADKTIGPDTIEHPLMTADDIRNEIARLEKVWYEYGAEIAERKSMLEEKLGAMAEGMVERASMASVGKLYMHTCTVGPDWKETVIGVVREISGSGIKFERCILFHDSKDFTYFETHRCPYYVEFKVEYFETGHYETPASEMWGKKNATKHLEIMELTEHEEDLLTEYIEIYKEFRKARIDDECEEYRKFVSDMSYSVHKDKDGEECQDKAGEEWVDVIDD